MTAKDAAAACFINPEIICVFGRDDGLRGRLPLDPGILRGSRAAGEGAGALSRSRRQACKRIEADGLLATCMQHEIDHLNGVLFIDYLSKLKRDRVHEEIHQSRQASGGVTFQAIAVPASAHAGQFDAMTLQCHFVSSSWARRISPCRRWWNWSRTAMRSLPSIPARRSPAGRGMTLQPTPVERRGTPFRHSRAHAEDIEDAGGAGGFRAHQADAAVVVAYGMILPQADPRRARSAASICMPRCCRAGAAPHRSTARSWRAMPKAASW